MKDKQLAEFSLDDGTKFLVEVEEPESSVIQRVALPTGQIVAKANQFFEQSLETKVAFMIPTSMLVSSWSNLGQWGEIVREQNTDALSNIPSFRQIQLKAKGGNLKILLAKYEAAYNQLNYTLSQSDVISIKEKIKFLESEIIQLETEINNLAG